MSIYVHKPYMSIGNKEIKYYTLPNFEQSFSVTAMALFFINMSIITQIGQLYNIKYIYVRCFTRVHKYTDDTTYLCNLASLIFLLDKYIPNQI